jgi:hypothetical protein
VGTLESLWVALDTLRTHKLRSFLTMLGVIFGVMAVVVMVALIEGARASVVQEFEKLGSDVILVTFDPSERIRREERGGTVEGLTVADLEAIRPLPELRAVAAERQLGAEGADLSGREGAGVADWRERRLPHRACDDHRAGTLLRPAASSRTRREAAGAGARHGAQTVRQGRPHRAVGAD